MRLIKIFINISSINYSIKEYGVFSYRMIKITSDSSYVLKNNKDTERTNLFKNIYLD